MAESLSANELSPETMSCIEDIARVYEGYGIPRIGGRMYGLLLLSSEPLSAERIAACLSASRSSVSTNVRGLIANGWVEKVTRPGDRTEYFKFSQSAWARVMERRMQSFEPLKRIAHKARKALPVDDPAQRNVEKMLAWIELQVRAHETMIAAWAEVGKDTI